MEKQGVLLSDDLIGATYGNPRGHFESKALVNFHERILNRNGIRFQISEWKKIKLNSQDKEQGLSLLNQGILGQVCKDPRTSLFAKYWAQWSPDSKFIFLIRDPQQVVNSLFARDLRQKTNWVKKLFLPLWHNSRNAWLRDSYFETWFRYNLEIREFLKEHADRAVLVRADSMQGSFPTSQLSEILTAWGLPSSQESFQEIYRSEELNTAKRQSIKSKASQKAHALYGELLAHPQCL
jgi:hypothetical protein